MKKNLITTHWPYKLLRIFFVQVALLALLHDTWQASVAFAQDVLEQKLTVDFKNIPLREALALLSKQVPVKFVYSGSHIHAIKKVTLLATQEKLTLILSQLLHPMDIEFKLSQPDFVVLKKKYSSSSLLLENMSNQTQAGENSSNVAAMLLTLSGKVQIRRSNPCRGWML